MLHLEGSGGPLTTSQFFRNFSAIFRNFSQFFRNFSAIFRNWIRPPQTAIFPPPCPKVVCNPPPPPVVTPHVDILGPKSCRWGGVPHRRDGGVYLDAPRPTARAVALLRVDPTRSSETGTVRGLRWQREGVAVGEWFRLLCWQLPDGGGGQEQLEENSKPSLKGKGAPGGGGGNNTSFKRKPQGLTRLRTNDARPCREVWIGQAPAGRAQGGQERLLRRQRVQGKGKGAIRRRQLQTATQPGIMPTPPPHVQRQVCRRLQCRPLLSDTGGGGSNWPPGIWADPPTHPHQKIFPQEKNEITSQRLLDQSQAGVYMGKTPHTPPFWPFWAYSRTLPQGVELLV